MRAEPHGLKVVEHDYDDIEISLEASREEVTLTQAGDSINFSASDAATFAKILADFAKKL